MGGGGVIPLSPAFLAKSTPEELQYFSRMTDTDPLLRLHLSALIRGLVADGLWHKLDKLTIAQTLESDSLLNIISASYPSVNMGCAFVADQGFTTAFATTHYLRSGFAEPGSGTKMLNNSASVFVYNRAARNNGVMMGTYDAAYYPQHVWSPAGSSTVRAAMQSFLVAESTTYAAGFQASSRVDASAVHVCTKRSAASASVAATSKTFPGFEFYVGTFNTGAALPTNTDDWADGQYAAHGVGAGLSVIELLALEARLQTYFTSRGSAV